MLCEQGEVGVEELFGGDERGFLALEDALLGSWKEALDGGVIVEAVAKLLVDALIHPVFGLLGTAMLKVAILLHEVHIFIDHIPDFLDTQTIKA